LVAANDLLALGCYDTIRSMGLQCPADLSVTGYNDMPFVDLVSPALTTVRVQHQELGAEAARLLLRKLEEPKSPVVERIYRPTLVIRRSTSAPASQTRRQV
jgi:LacI family transcriptional regulator